MKLATIETFVVGNPAPGAWRRYFLFVKLTTACGVVGYGEMYNASFGAHTMARMAEDVFEVDLVDEDPFKIERIHDVCTAAAIHRVPIFR